MAQVTFTLVINDEISITSGTPPTGEVNIPYSHQFTATGGSGSYSWQVVAGILPAGLTLNPSSGLLSGTPTAAGTFANITVEVTSA